MTTRRSLPARALYSALALAGCSPAAMQTNATHAPARTEPAAAREADAGSGERVAAGVDRESDEQLRATLSRGFDSERLVIRTRLATAAADSPTGLFARAWLAGRAGDQAERLRLLDECLRRSPGYEPCAAHRVDALPGDATDEQALGYYEPAAAHAEFPAMVVIAIAQRLHDRAAAVRWLAAREQEHPRSYAFDFLRGLELANRSPAGAVDLYRRAILEREGYFSNVVETALDLIARGLRDESPDERVREMVDLVQSMDGKREARDVAQAWYVAGAAVRDRLNDNRTAAAMFLRSYEVYPSPDAAHAAFELLTLDNAPQAETTVRAARERFPGDPNVLADAGRWKFLAESDLDAAQALYQQAVDGARDPVERRDLVHRFAWELLQRVARFDRVRELVGSVPAALRSDLLVDQEYEARLRSGDLAGAGEMLVRWHDATQNPREIFFLSQRERAGAYNPEPLALSRGDRFAPSFLGASGDGRYYSSGTSPSRVYNASTGRAVANLRRGGPRLFSPDGRLIAATVSFTEQSGDHTYGVVVYEAATGRLARYFDVPSEVRGFAWHPSSTRLAWFEFDGLVTEADVTDGTRRFTRGAPTRRTGLLAYAGGGQYLVTAAAEADEMLVHRESDLGVERTLEGVSWVHGMATTADGRYLVCADNAMHLTVYDSRNWSMRRMDLPATASQVSVHPREPVVLLAGAFRDHPTLVNVERMEIVRDLRGRWNGGAVFLGPNKILVETEAGMDTIAYPSLRAAGSRARAGTGGLGIIGLDDGTRVGVRFAHRIAVVDATTGGEGRHWSLEGDIRARPGHHEIVTVVGHTLHRLDTQTGRDHRSELPINFDVQSVWVGPTRVAVAGVAGADPTGQHQTPESGAVAVFDLDSGAPVWQHEIPVVTGSRRFDRLYRSVLRVVLDEENQRVAVASSWQDGFGNPETFGRDVRVWQLGGTTPTVIHTNTQIQDMKLAEAGVLRVWHFQDYEAYRTTDGQRAGAGQYQLALAGGASALWGLYRIDVVDGRGHLMASHDFESDVVGIVPLADGSVAGLDGAGNVVRVAAPAQH